MLMAIVALQVAAQVFQPVYDLVLADRQSNVAQPFL